jgi:hypothetical protein
LIRILKILLLGDRDQILGRSFIIKEGKERGERRERHIRIFYRSKSFGFFLSSSLPL